MHPPSPGPNLSIRSGHWRCPTSEQPESPKGWDFFVELKRRHVYRAGAAYLAIAFAGLEGASMVFPAFGLGPRVFNALVLVTVLGFPVAVGLAWAFDFTGEGIRRTDPTSAEPAPAAGSDWWIRAKAALVGAGFVAMVWLGVRVWQPLGGETHTGVPVDAPVLAVLPFDDPAAEESQAYFATGLHDELLHQLSSLRGIHLTSRTSVNHFRGSTATLSTIADSLGVRYILEGRLRRAADSAHLTVRLVDAMRDEPVWSEAYTFAPSLDAVFGLQRTLATRVAGLLGGTLAAGTGRVPGTPPTSSLDAYNAYLRGLSHYARFDLESLHEAAADLQRAVTLDPEFGRAHGKLAHVYGVINTYAGGVQGEFLPRLREHAQLALEHAPEDPVSHMAMASFHWALERDWAAVRRELERALELDPDYADARWALAEWHGVIAGNTNRGLEIIEEARRLDPLSLQPPTVRAWILTHGGRHLEAAEVYRRLLEREPGERAFKLNLASSLALAGRRQEARRLVREVYASDPAPRPVTMAIHLARAGDTATAREVLRDAVALKEDGGSVPASGVAGAYAALGEVEAALDWLERSFEREGGVYTLRHPDYLALRGHPRFRALWDRVGLLGDPGNTD